MIPVRFSRRQLLVSMLAALTGMLRPRRTRTMAAPPQLAPQLRRGRYEFREVITSTYDPWGRLISVVYQPPSSADKHPGLSPGNADDLAGDGIVSRYDSRDSHFGAKHAVS